LCVLAAGRNITNEELEDVLEQGNPAVFTQGVSTKKIMDPLLHLG
jgi:hypothetical protein